MEKKSMVIAAIILLLLAGAGWAFLSREDPQFVQAEQKRDELFQKVDTMSREQRRTEFEALREQTRDFSDAQRKEFRNGMRKFFVQRVDRLLAMPKAEQREELDKWIDRMEERRAEREAGGKERGDERRGRDRGQDLSSAERDQRHKERLDRSSPQMRAKMDALKDLLNERREERGLEPIQGGGPRMFGPPRGGPR